MREIHDRAMVRCKASPESIFAVITDIDSLPSWNAAIEKVIDRQPALRVGAVWTVQMHPNRAMRWRSASTVRAFDPDSFHFAYRTVNADGNPSHALWDWRIDQESGLTTVSVHWDVYLETLDRRFFAGPIRKRQLRKEVAASLQAVVALTGLRVR